MPDWYRWCQPDCTADIDMTPGRKPLIAATKQWGNGACSSWHSNGYHDSALSTDAFNGARRPTRSARQCLGSAVQPPQGTSDLAPRRGPRCRLALAQRRQTVTRTQVNENCREAIE